jgi:hypothetical protein
MKRISLAAVSTLIAALLWTMPALACTSDCNPPEGDIVVFEGYFQDPEVAESVSEVRGANTFITDTDKTWQWYGDLVGYSTSSLEIIVHASSGLMTAREWGTISVDSLDGENLDPDEDTMLVRTIASGYYPNFSVHMEIVGGTGYFEGAAGYFNAELDASIDPDGEGGMEPGYGTYTLYIVLLE